MMDRVQGACELFKRGKHILQILGRATKHGDQAIAYDLADGDCVIRTWYFGVRIAQPTQSVDFVVLS